MLASRTSPQDCLHVLTRGPMSPEVRGPRESKGEAAGPLCSHGAPEGGDPNHRQDWSTRRGWGGGIPSVAETCRQAVPGKAEKQVVVTGGGAWNTPAGARGHGSLLRHGTSSGGGGLVGQRLGKDGRLGQSVMEEELPEPAGKQRQALPFFLFLFFCYTVQRAES